MASPKVNVQLAQNLSDAQARMKGLLDDSRKFNNDCEEVFENFRRAVVHCKNNKAEGKTTLDALNEKEIAVSFMCKFCKARPGFGNRCKEVLNHLMLSDEWKKKFQEDPEATELPAGIVEQLGEGTNAAGTSIAAVVQRCTKAMVLSDEQAGLWQQVGRGLLICIDFRAETSKVKIRDAARSLLNAPLSSGADRKSVESVLALVRKGEEQNIVVISQSSLLSKLKTSETGDVEIERKEDVEAESLQGMINEFVAQMRELSKEADVPPLERSVSNSSTSSSSPSQNLKIVCPQCRSPSWEVSSDGLMHSLTF